ncbi:hypothetical protein, partial [Mesorhizobium sp. M0496]|uniref:hypothetical protein n=1 Tax=Mesorhizobium sp. M0496 TaxID=2956952 RepID=UPI00333A6737
NYARKDDLKSAASLPCHARARRPSPEAYDKSDHATPLLEAIAPSLDVGSNLAVFRMPLADGPYDMPEKNGVLSLLAQQIC